MQVIADHLNISKATIFHHFTNKQELFFQMWLMNFARFQRLLQDAAGQPELVSAQAQLRSIMHCLARLSGFDTSRMLQDIAVFLSPEQQETIRQSGRAILTIVRQVLEQGIERGELKPHNTQLAAYALLHLGRLLPPPHMSPLASLSQDAAIDTLLD